MTNLVSGEIGMIHLITSCLAVVFGSIILAARKGTRFHRKMGYAYVSSMLGLIITSFLLYNLFGGFGIFHIAAIISTITLIMGMLPLYTRAKGWRMHHFSWMYWSVIGLYAALLSEVFTRVLPTPFFTGVGLGTLLITAGGAIMFRKNLSSWQTQFDTN